MGDKPDVRKQWLLFDALNSIMDRAGYKVPDKLQADIKQESQIFQDMSKEELIEFIKRPSIQEVIREEDDGEVKH